MDMLKDLCRSMKKEKSHDNFLEKWSLFYNGAYKYTAGNLGGGTIYRTNYSIITYCLSLGKTSNNFTEFSALLWGFKLCLDRKRETRNLRRVPPSN